MSSAQLPVDTEKEQQHFKCCTSMSNYRLPLRERFLKEKRRKRRRKSKKKGGDSINMSLLLDHP